MVGRVDGVVGRVDGVVGRVDGVLGRVDGVLGRVDGVLGRVDGVVSDVPGMEYAFTKMQGLAVVERIKTGEQYGLMVTKDSPLVEKSRSSTRPGLASDAGIDARRSGAAPKRLSRSAIAVRVSSG